MYRLILVFAGDTDLIVGFVVRWIVCINTFRSPYPELCVRIPASILYKSIAGRYRPVSYPDGPISARYRFMKTVHWYVNVLCSIEDSGGLLDLFDCAEVQVTCWLMCAFITSVCPKTLISSSIKIPESVVLCEVLFTWIDIGPDQNVRFRLFGRTQHSSVDRQSLE